MPRLRNERTGVVVNVDDGLASRLGGEWVKHPKAPAPKSQGGTKSADKGKEGQG